VFPAVCAFVIPEGVVAGDQRIRAARRVFLEFTLLNLAAGLISSALFSLS
jgi:hypothetical protein